MNAILTWVIISAVIFLIFAVLMLTGIIRKNFMLVYISVAVFFVFAGAGLYTSYLFVSKSWYSVQNSLKPRSGIEIYAALFEMPRTDCVQVIHAVDQMVPKVDYAIWLEFSTCPEEFNRILTQQHYSHERQKASLVDSPRLSAGYEWFDPHTLGDSINIYTWKRDELGNGQTIYVNDDTTRAFCIDILD